MTTTFRADIRSGLVTLTEAFATAYGDRVRRVFPVRPESLPPAEATPYAYVDLLGEEQSHTSGTRTRTTAPSVVLVDRITDSLEAVTRFDETVDLFTDHCTANPHAVTGGVLDRVTVTDAFDEGMYLVRFTFNGLSILEGRN